MKRQKIKSCLPGEDLYGAHLYVRPDRPERAGWTHRAVVQSSVGSHVLVKSKHDVLGATAGLSSSVFHGGTAGQASSGTRRPILFEDDLGEEAAD